MFFIVLVCYADRTNLGVVLAQADFPGVAHSENGIIMSAFFVGYMCTQIPGGMLARKWGAKPVLLAAALIWTCFDVLTPFAAMHGPAVMFLDRMFMGFGEGMMYPAQYSLITFWAPKQERAFYCTFMTSGQDLGSMMANSVSPQLLEAGDPKGGPLRVFAFWGAAAVLWALLFGAISSSAPELHGPCQASGESAWIRENRHAPHIDEVRRAPAPPCPGWLWRAPSAWGIIIAHFGANYTGYVVISWMPTFFKQAHDVDLAANPLLLAAPYLAGAVGGVLAGRTSDALVACGLRIRHVRKTVQFLAATGLAVFLQFAARAQSPTTAAVWMSVAVFFMRVQNAGYWTNIIDICPEAAPSLMGVSNSIATIPGILGQPITQAILQKWQSWPAVFGVGGVIGLVTTFAFVLLSDDVPLAGSFSRAEDDGMRPCMSPDADGVGPVEVAATEQVQPGGRLVAAV